MCGKCLIICEYNIINHPGEENARSYARIAESIGYNSKIITFDYDSVDDKPFIRSGISYDVFGICSLRNNGLKRRIERNQKKTQIIESIFDENKPTIIFYMGDYATSLFIRTKKMAKKNGCILILQMCEWYTWGRLKNEADSIKYKLSNLIWYLKVFFSRKCVFPRCDNILCVSRKLYDYFESKNCHSIMIPNLLSGSPKNALSTDHDHLIIGYFGNPGIHNSKDLLCNFIHGVAHMPIDYIRKVRIRLYGIEKADLEPLYDINKNAVEILGDSLEVYGKIPKNEIADKLIECDFTALFRKQNPSIDAGLSSKMTESIFYGVPLICNLTSNMGDYLVDGYNSIVCDSSDVDEVSKGVIRALNLTYDEITTMKTNSLESGSKYFGWESYVDIMKTYIEACE